MEELTEFENAVLAKLLAGKHPTLAALRSQAEVAYLASREYTGSGFYCAFMVPPDVRPLASHSTFHFGDVNAKIKGLEHGAGFVLFVKNGRLDMLEGYTYEEPWPETLDDFELSYQSDPRIVNLSPDK